MGLQSLHWLRDYLAGPSVVVVVVIVNPILNEFKAGAPVEAFPSVTSAVAEEVIG